MEKIAFLIDYENFPCSPEGLHKLLTEISSRGSLVVKRAYADWVRFSDWRQSVLACQIEMIELPFATKGKNSADIRMVVDAMEFIFTKPHITTFVIASADADFLPLLSRLREFNKRTIVVAGSGNTQAYMRTHCDEFLDGDTFLANYRQKRQPDAQRKTSLPQSSVRLCSPSPEQLKELQAMFLEAWSTFGKEHAFDLSQIGYQLRKLKPDLAWQDFGFKSLKPLIAHMVTLGFLRIDFASGTTNNVSLTARAKRAFKSAASKAPSAAALRESVTLPEMNKLEWELVPLIQQLVQKELRWDELRNSLIDMHPKSSGFLQQDDDFLKLLQSLDANKTITLKYDSALSTYHVSAGKVEQLQPTECEPIANRNLVYSPLWIQPELF